MHVWLRLKPELLPCVSQETDKFIQEYHTLLEKHRGGDQDLSEEIMNHQALIKSRIADFDKFYELNYSCPTIGYFEKLKMKLRKLLFIAVQEPQQEQLSPQGGQDSTFVDMCNQEQPKKGNKKQQLLEVPDSLTKSKGSKSPGSSSKSPIKKKKDVDAEGLGETKVKRSSSKEKATRGKSKDEVKKVTKTKKIQADN